jgi:hypothetical protein
LHGCARVGTSRVRRPSPRAGLHWSRPGARARVTKGMVGALSALI